MVRELTARGVVHCYPAYLEELNVIRHVQGTTGMTMYDIVDTHMLDQ